MKSGPDDSVSTDTEQATDIEPPSAPAGEPSGSPAGAVEAGAAAPATPRAPKPWTYDAEPGDVLAAVWQDSKSTLRFFVKPRTSEGYRFRAIIEYKRPDGSVQQVGMGGVRRGEFRVTDGFATNAWGRIGWGHAPLGTARVSVFAKGAEIASAEPTPSDKLGASFFFIKIPNAAPEFDEAVAYGANNDVIARHGS